MLASLAFIFLVGLSLGGLCNRLRLPRIIGLLATGIILGPYFLNLLSDSILQISPDLREMALIVILLQAGLSMSLSDLRKVGRPAILMSFIPALFELGAYIILAPMLFGITRLEAAIMGAVMGAVSPAVVVPKMVGCIHNGYGTKKTIPQMIIAGSSLDDVFVIVLFSAFLKMEQGGAVGVKDFLSIPTSIGLGILVGVVGGFILYEIFENSFKHKHLVRNSIKALVILAVSFLFASMEGWLEPYVSFSGMLAVVSMAVVIKLKSISKVTDDLNRKLGKIWLGAEVILFVLVGAAVDIQYTMTAGVSALIMIFLGLLIRSIGVIICMVGTDLNFKEKVFCSIAYIPKATVQAAIGSVPLAMGLDCGKIVLCVAVVSILVTAPLGAILIDNTYKKLLTHNEEDDQSLNQKLSPETV